MTVLSGVSQLRRTVPMAPAKFAERRERWGLGFEDGENSQQ